MAKATAKFETVTEMQAVKVEKQTGVTLELTIGEAAQLSRMFDLDYINYLEQLFGCGYGGSRDFTRGFYTTMKYALLGIPEVVIAHSELQPYMDPAHRPF